MRSVLPCRGPAIDGGGPLCIFPTIPIARCTQFVSSTATFGPPRRSPAVVPLRLPPRAAPRRRSYAALVHELDHGMAGELSGRVRAMSRAGDGNVADRRRPRPRSHSHVGSLLRPGRVPRVIGVPPASSGVPTHCGSTSWLLVSTGRQCRGRGWRCDHKLATVACHVLSEVARKKQRTSSTQVTQTKARTAAGLSAKPSNALAVRHPAYRRPMAEAGPIPSVGFRGPFPNSRYVPPAGSRTTVPSSGGDCAWLRRRGTHSAPPPQVGPRQRERIALVAPSSGIASMLARSLRPAAAMKRGTHRGGRPYPTCAQSR